MLGFPEVADKTFHHVTSGTLVLDILRQSYATFHRTVDQDANSAGIGEGDIVKRFHKNTKTPHQQSRNNKRQENAGRIEVGKIRSGQLTDTVFGKGNKHQGDGIAIDHTHQIDETRVTHETRVGVENPKAWNAQQHEYQEGVNHRDSVLKQLGSIMEHPVCHDATENHDTAVDQKNAPIW